MGDQACHPLATGGAGREVLANVRRHAIAESRPGSTVTFRRTTSHASGRVVEHVLPTAIRANNAKPTGLGDAEKYGQSTRRLMKEIGFTSAECDQLLRSAVIPESWCDQYLPGQARRIHSMVARGLRNQFRFHQRYRNHAFAIEHVHEVAQHEALARQLHLA